MISRRAFVGAAAAMPTEIVNEDYGRLREGDIVLVRMKIMKFHSERSGNVELRLVGRTNDDFLVADVRDIAARIELKGEPDLTTLPTPS